MTVGPLARIDLSLEVLKSTQGTATHFSPAHIRFIYGIGANGLTPFEILLHGRSQGDSLNLRIEEGQAYGQFEHLACEMLEAVGCQPPFDLKVSIVSVQVASSREVVKAMAQKGGCGDGCGCGC